MVHQQLQFKLTLYKIDCNSSSRIESFTIIEYLIPANISVCGIDLSGSGLSEGEYISLGYYESKDVICLYDYLRENKFRRVLSLLQDYGVDPWVL